MILYILCTYFVVGQLANDYYSVAWGVGESIWIKWLHWFYMNSWSSDDEPAHDPRNNLCSFHPLSHFDGWQSLAAHVRWGESTTSELQIMTIWEFVAWDVGKDRFKSPGPHVEVVQPDRHMVMNESKKPLFGKEHVDCKHISQMSMTSWTMPWTEQITALRIGFIFSQDRSMKSPASLYKSKWIN